MNGISNNNTTRHIMDFFERKTSDALPQQMGYGVVREGMRDELMEYCHQQQQEAREMDIAAAKKEVFKPVELSADQMQYLTNKYNPRKMSNDEYNAFVQDMVDMGVVAEEDTHFLVPGATPIFAPGTFEHRRLDTELAPYFQFGCDVPLRYDDCGGNVLNWYGFQAAYRAYDPNSGTYYRSKRERVCEKVHSVLQQMDQNTPYLSQEKQASVQKDYKVSRLAWDLKYR